MNNQENQYNKMEFIEYDSFLQVLNYLGGQQFNQNFPQLFHCNYEKIFDFIQALLNRNIPHEYSHYLSNSSLTYLLQKFSLPIIIYAFLIKIYKYNQALINFSIQEKNRFFISDIPNQPIILLETFVNILQESNINQPSMASQVLNAIKKKVHQSIKKVEDDPQSRLISSQMDESGKHYKSKVIVNGLGKVEYQQDDLICSSTSSYYKQRHQFYAQLFKNIMVHFSKEVALKILDQALLLFAITTYIESISLQNKKNKKNNKNTFPMEMPVVQEIVDIKHFEISLIFLQKKQDYYILQLKLKIKDKTSTKTIVDFHHQQINVSLALKAEKLTSKLIYVQNMVHCIDSSKELGKGSYGVVHKCTSFELFNCTQNSNQKKYLFKTQHLAAKELSFAGNESQFHKVPLNRQHLILHLIHEIRHKQQIKNMKRQLGVEDERQIVGINRMISLVQYFKIQTFNKERQKDQQIYYLIFELGHQSLSDRQLLSNLYKVDNYSQQIYKIFYQLFQAINFLHYQINTLYPAQLNRYFKLQNKDDKNYQKQEFECLDIKGRNSIYHRDIKPSNIVVKCNQKNQISEVYLIDFGMAKITNFNKNSYSTTCGSTYYMAAQMRHGVKHDETLDIWSTGVILFQMYFKNQKKLYNNTQIHSMDAVNSKLEHHLQAVEQDQWRQCLASMLNINIDQRKKANQLLQLLLRQKHYLKQQNREDIFKHFQSCKRYSFNQNHQSGEITIIEQHEPYNLSQQIHFSAFTLNEYLSNNLLSPIQRFKTALIALFHIYCTSEAPNISQTLSLLGQSKILRISDTQIQYKIKYDSSLGEQVELPSLKFAKQLSQANSIVLLSTHIAFYKFNPQLLPGYEKKHKYRYGFPVRKQSIFKGRVKIFELVQSQLLSKELTVIQQKNSNTIFTIKCSIDEFDLLIFKPLEWESINIDSICQQIRQFIELHTNTGKKIVLQKYKQQFLPQERLLSLVKCKLSSQCLRISLNEQTVKLVMSKSVAIFNESTKRNIVRILNLVSCPYSYKFYTCLYLHCSSLTQFALFQAKNRGYCVSSKKIQAQMEQFNFLLLHLYQIAQFKAVRKVIDYIRLQITKAVQLNLQFLNEDQQKKEHSQLQQLDISFPLRKLQQIQSLFTNCSAETRLKAKQLKCIGCKILQFVNTIKIYRIYNDSKYCKNSI